MPLSRQSYENDFPLLEKPTQRIDLHYKASKRSRAHQGGAADQEATTKKPARPEQAKHEAALTTTGLELEDVERPMLRRIKELENRFAVVDPERCVRDVEATGYCFFLCGNLALQDEGRAPRTSSDEQLREAADHDRLIVLALMLERQHVPMDDGDTLEIKMGLAALEPFPGPPACSCVYTRQPTGRPVAT